MSKDYGAAVSQKGYDVKTCDDRFLVYSSAFQNLKMFSTQEVSAVVPADVGAGFQDFTVATTDIFTSAAHGLANGNKIIVSCDSGGAGLNDHTIYFVVQKTTDTFKVSLTSGGAAVDVTSAGSGYWWTAPNRITITHNLGYLAGFLVIYTGSSAIGRNFNSLFSYGGNSTFSTMCRQYANKLEIDIDTYAGNYAAPGTTLYFTVIQFLDDFSTIAARSINSGTTSGASSTDYGIRVSKDGYDVKSCTDEQCVFSSSFFSQIVHMKGVSAGDTVTHSLGYVPNYLLYSALSDADGAYIYYEDWFGGSDATYIYTGGAGNYYIIFKDKLN